MKNKKQQKPTVSRRGSKQTLSIGDKVKWAQKAQSRMTATYCFYKGLGPKPHSFVGTIVANYPSVNCFSYGKFVVDFGHGLRETAFGEDLQLFTPST